ncbi:sugar ABC transporter ATP-binding protein [Oceaniglobus ichthyenteri]|uniref:sugar ABC transporter ATP-binding protein n=1 Tax=Oceaniglobus ichthyenteri TaxID=2136177 RepID=UPI000D3DB506|nr:sugar ABC transporter ATP-binding protein [Oceaniglobus ichthyenteri]
MTSAVLTVEGVRKSFGRNAVLKNVALSLDAGTVTVLMGANGAGKSTLVKAICGIHGLDGGEMRLSGAPYAPATAADALSQGVVAVHQNIDDGVIPDLDVATNLMLDQLTKPGAKTFVRDRVLRAQAGEIARSMGLKMDVKTRVSDLNVADRQLIAIARAMARAPKVLILDEPTSSLSATEADRLFGFIDRLRAQGVAILYISHRMSDIRRIADRIISMRDGQVSGTFEGAPLDYEGAVTAMLGHKMTDVNITPKTGGAAVLEIENLSLRPGWPTFNITAHKGEVIAITGLLGSGKSQLADIIFGLRKPAAGTMKINGAPYDPANANGAIAAGVYMSPKDRGNNAVVPAFNITDNMSLPFLRAFSTLSFIRQTQQRRATTDMIDRIGVVCQSQDDGIGTLSGGNQQKVMIGRWLLKPSQVLLLDEPFQGVDIGARRDIGRHIRETAGERATLVFVAEIDEAIEIADRIIVLNEGNLVGEHENSNLDLAALVAQITGEKAA